MCLLKKFEFIYWILKTVNESVLKFKQEATSSLHSGRSNSN